MSNGFLLAAHADLPDLREIADGFGLDVVSPQTFSTDAAAAAAMQGAANVGIVLTHAATRDTIYVGLLQMLSRTLRSAQLILEDPSIRQSFAFLPDAWPVMPLGEARTRALDLLRRRAGADEGTPRAHPLPPAEPSDPPEEEANAEAPPSEAPAPPSDEQQDMSLFLGRVNRDRCREIIDMLRARGTEISLDPDSLSEWGNLGVIVRTGAAGEKSVAVFWTPIEPPDADARTDHMTGGLDDLARRDDPAPLDPVRDLVFQSGDISLIITDFDQAPSTEVGSGDDTPAIEAPGTVDEAPLDSFGAGGSDQTLGNEETAREITLEDRRDTDEPPAPETPPPAPAPSPQTSTPTPAPPPFDPPLPRRRGSSGASAPADATAFAPKKLRRGTPELVRIVIHQPQDLKAVIEEARQIDPSTNPAPSGMRVGDVPIGASVGVMLEVRGASCDGAMQRRTWSGRSIDFNFSAEAEDDVKQAVFLARVFVNDAQIGVLAFTRPIGGPKKNAASAERVRLKRHKRVFLSYSSKDRETVSAIATAYAAAGVEHFFDRTSLKSGEEWSPRLRREIERADLFHLCWSKSAASSEWVEKEAEHALTRNKRSNGKKPEITVQMLDGPPWAPHPRHLDSINFDDFVRAAIVGYARGDGSN